MRITYDPICWPPRAIAAVSVSTINISTLASTIDKLASIGAIRNVINQTGLRPQPGEARFTGFVQMRVYEVSKSILRFRFLDFEFLD